MTCLTCSGATDIPDGRGGIKPCPDCQEQQATRAQKLGEMLNEAAGHNQFLRSLEARHARSAR